MQCNHRIGQYIVVAPCRAACCAGDGMVYISHNGCLTHAWARAACFETRADANDDCEFWQKHYPAYSWRVETLAQKGELADPESRK